MCKYLPILHPDLLHHSFPLSCFLAIKLSSRFFSLSQTLFSVLCALTDVHIYAGNCYFPHIPQSMGSPGCSHSASHLLSSCNPNSLFQLIISPTISFALASTCLSLLFQAWFLSGISHQTTQTCSVGWLVISSLPATGTMQPWGIKAVSPCPRLSAQGVGHCKLTVHKYLVQVISKTWKADCQHEDITHSKTETNNYLTGPAPVHGPSFPKSCSNSLIFHPRHLAVIDPPAFCNLSVIRPGMFEPTCTAASKI